MNGQAFHYRHWSIRKVRTLSSIRDQIVDIRLLSGQSGTSLVNCKRLVLPSLPRYGVGRHAETLNRQSCFLPLLSGPYTRSERTRAYRLVAERYKSSSQDPSTTPARHWGTSDLSTGCSVYVPWPEHCKLEHWKGVSIPLKVSIWKCQIQWQIQICRFYRCSHAVSRRWKTAVKWKPVEVTPSFLKKQSYPQYAPVRSQEQLTGPIEQRGMPLPPCDFAANHSKLSTPRS